MNYNLSELKKNYDIELNLKFESNDTINSYKSALNKFLNENSRVYRMSVNDLKEYFCNFKKRYSPQYYNVMGAAIKIFFELILKQPFKMFWFSRIKTERNSYNIITWDDFVYMMKNTDQIKHKTMIILLFSTGIRTGEMLNIKMEDVDVINQQIYINTKKHGDKRFVYIHDLALKYLKAYFKKWKPKNYLFEGQNQKYSKTSLQKIIKKASIGLNKKIWGHLFRHTYITELIENENVFKAKDRAGHRSLKSTLHYYHVPLNQLKAMYNPLDKIVNNPIDKHS